MPIQLTNLPFRQEHWDKLNTQCQRRCVHISQELLDLQRYGNKRFETYKRFLADLGHLIDWTQFREQYGTPVPVDGVPIENYHPNEMDGPTYANLVGHGWGECYWLVLTDQGKWVRLWASFDEMPEVRGQVEPTQWGDEPYFGKAGI